MRIEKVNELLRQEIGKIFIEELEFKPGVIVTVINVETSDSLESAVVWISIFPEDQAESVLNFLTKKAGDIQSILNKRLKLRFVPRIGFKIDKSGNYVSYLDKLFEEID